MHNYELLFNSMQQDGTEVPYRRVVAADTHAVARAFARAMVGEPVGMGHVLVGVTHVHVTEDPPSMGESALTNAQVWRNILCKLGVPPERCTPVYSFQIGLPHNIRESTDRLPEDVRQPEIVGFTFIHKHELMEQGDDFTPWKYRR